VSSQVARTPVAIGRQIAVAPAARFTPVAFQVSRCYSAAAGLQKNEVEGRIVDLLKNFDKVWGQHAVLDISLNCG
jgi:NADH dehydrogenase (ubiquinone) 1 alpha/beta subcomplex 1